jgi:hypothetical protein
LSNQDGLGFFMSKINQGKIMIELACDDLLFHFNKKHLEDSSIPMWIITTKGTSYYVDHVECNVKWSTRERPDSSHTKGSIKIKDCLLLIDDSNTAIITQLTEHDKIRLKNREKGITRIITEYGSLLRESLQQTSIKHGPIKTYGGGCGTLWFITDILKESHLTMLQIQMGDKIRVLKENEGYYKYYDDPSAYDDDYD